MKTLKFREQLASDVLKGEKTATWRLFDDKDLKVGDIVELVVWETNEKFAKVEITEVTEKNLGDVEENDYEGHEKFQDKESMLKSYQQYYGDKVNFSTLAKLVRFKLLESQ